MLQQVKLDSKCGENSSLISMQTLMRRLQAKFQNQKPNEIEFLTKTTLSILWPSLKVSQFKNDSFAFD